MEFKLARVYRVRTAFKDCRCGFSRASDSKSLPCTVIAVESTSILSLSRLTIEITCFTTSVFEEEIIHTLFITPVALSSCRTIARFRL